MELRSVKENVSAWHLSVNQIKERRKKAGHLEWDKDDDDSLMFVSAASNIRSSIFNIEQKSSWKVKEMAGNIIPGKNH
jgi:ubiquitin-like 1-activating enzyme E1 B